MFGQLASDGYAIATFVVGWLVIGTSVGAVAGRLGHRGRTWMGIGIALGPLSVPLLLLHRHRASEVDALVLDEGQRRDEGLDVMLVLCGDVTDVTEVLPFLRSRPETIRRIVLARPVEVESLSEPGWDAAARSADRSLADAASYVGPPAAQLVLLPGCTAGAIADFVEDESIDELVVLGNPRVARAVERHPVLSHLAITERAMTWVTSSPPR